MSQVVIGLSGLAQSGKTTAANYIERVYGIRRKHIAEPLRGMLKPLLSANGIPDDMIHRYLEGDLKENVIPEIGRSGRHLQITLGTEWGRNLVDKALWARTWRRGVRPGDRVMNDSVRFPNEEQEIRLAGGFTIMIDRPGTKPAQFKWGAIGRMLYKHLGIMSGVHDSERVDRLDPDYRIRNNGSIEDLYRAIDEIMDYEAIAPLAAETKKAA